MVSYAGVRRRSTSWKDGIVGKMFSCKTSPRWIIHCSHAVLWFLSYMSLLVRKTTRTGSPSVFVFFNESTIYFTTGSETSIVVVISITVENVASELDTAFALMAFVAFDLAVFDSGHDFLDNTFFLLNHSCCSFILFALLNRNTRRAKLFTLKKLLLRILISLKGNFIRMLIFTLGLLSELWGCLKKCLHAFLRWQGLLVGYHSGKK